MRKKILTIEENDLNDLEKKLLNVDNVTMSTKLFLSLYRERNSYYELSLIDPLTNVYNRRGFFLLVNQEMKLLKRKRFKSYFWYLDINKFKEINDTLGHEIGDEALRCFAAILKKSVRESDIIGRIGGDEFGIFVVDGYVGTGNVLRTRLKNNLDSFNKTKKLYKLDISIGISEYDPYKDQSLDNLLNIADKEMYRHKKGNK